MIEEDSFNDEIEVSASTVSIEDDDLYNSVEPQENSLMRKDTNSEDSYRQKVITSKEEGAEEGHSSELLERARIIYQEVVKSASFSSQDIHFIVSLYTEKKTKKRFIESVSNEAITGLLNCLSQKCLDAKTLKALFKLFSIVAIDAKQQSCQRPLNDIDECIKVMLDAADFEFRCMGCQFMAILLDQASKLHAMTESQEEEVIPSALIQGWCLKLCNRQFDKSPLVRSLALEAFVRIPPEEFQNNEGEVITAADVVSNSLYDTSVDVRKSAIKLITMSSPKIIDESITYLANEDNSRLRQLMIERLCKEVHIRSFTMPQRMRLIFNIVNDPIKDIQNLLGTLVVPRWLQWLAWEDMCDESESNSDEMPSKMAYPMILIKYLDYLECEKNCAIIMKLAFTSYMKSVEIGTDAKEFLLHMKKIPKELRESSGILHRQNFADLVRKDDTDLPQRLFVHRCLVELVNSIYTTPEQYGDRDYCINKLLPNFKEMATIFHEYSQKILYLCETPSTIQIFTLNQIMRLVHFIDCDCSVGRQIYMLALKRILLDENYYSPLEIIETCVDNIFKFFSEKIEYLKFLESLCPRLTKIVGTIDLKESDIDTRIKDEKQYLLALRASSVIHSCLRYEKITEVLEEIVVLCSKLIPSLVVASTRFGRQLCCRLVGVVGLRQKGNFMDNHIITLRSTIENDNPVVKEIALQVLGDLLIKYNFRYVANRYFPDIADQMQRISAMKHLFEKSVIDAEEANRNNHLIIACRLCFFFGWSEIVGSILFKVFGSKQVSKEELDLLDFFFTNYIQNQGDQAKLVIVNGFAKCAELSKDHNGFHYGQLTSFVYKKISLEVMNIKKPLPHSITPETILSLHILSKIREDPYSDRSESLACICLTGASLLNVPEVYGQQIHQQVEEMSKLFDIDSAVKRKIITSLNQYIKSIRKKFKIEGTFVPSSVRKRHASRSDQEDTVAETPLHTPSRRRRPRISSVSSEIKREIVDKRLSTVHELSFSSEDIITIESDSEGEKMCLTLIKECPSGERSI